MPDDLSGLDVAFFEALRTMRSEREFSDFQNAPGTSGAPGRYHMTGDLGTPPATSYTPHLGYAVCESCNATVGVPCSLRGLVDAEIDHALTGCNGMMRLKTATEMVRENRFKPPEAVACEVYPERSPAWSQIKRRPLPPPPMRTSVPGRGQMRSR